MWTRATSWRLDAELLVDQEQATYLWQVEVMLRDARGQQQEALSPASDRHAFSLRQSPAVTEPLLVWVTVQN